MAGFVALGDNKFIGTLTNGTANLEIGAFVVPNWGTGVASAAANTTEGDGDVMFVANELETIAEQFIDDVDFKIPSGEFLKLKVPQKGEIFVTTKYSGTPAVGAVLAVGANGVLEAVAARTPKHRFVVKEAETFLGANALRVVAL